MPKRYTISRSRTPDLTDTDARHVLVRKLEEKFPDLHIYEKGFDAEKKGYLIYGDKCDDIEKCHCFLLVVDNDYILIDEIKYKGSELCNLSGTTILSGLTEVFKRMKIKRVWMYDKAKIQFGEIKVNLAKYNILLHGESWYNRYGYRSTSYPEEIEHNREIRDAKISSANMKKILNMHCSADFNPAGKTYHDLIKFIDTGLRQNKNDECCLALLKLLDDKKFMDIQGFKTKGKLYYDFVLEQSFSKRDSNTRSRSRSNSNRRSNSKTKRARTNI